MNEELKRKLKIERVEICLNCQLFVGCDCVGKFEECADFLEVGSEKMVVVVSLDKYAMLKCM